MPTAQTSGPVHTTQQQTPYGSLVQAQLAPPYSYGTTNLPTHTGGTTSTNQPVPHQAPYSVPGLPGGTSNPLPVTLIHRVTTGWPNGHPYLTANHYNGLHPSKVPDIYFLRDHINPYLSIKDPYKEGPFDASRTPVSLSHSPFQSNTALITCFINTDVPSLAPVVDTLGDHRRQYSHHLVPCGYLPGLQVALSQCHSQD